jgi:hypothetical protein
MRGLFGLARPGPAVLLLLGLSSLSSAAVAREFDISFNDDAFRSGFALTLQDNLRVGAGVLHSSDAGSVISAGLQVTGGVGARLAYLDGDGSQGGGYALGLGGSVRWALPGYERFDNRPSTLFDTGMNIDFNLRF